MRLPWVADRMDDTRSEQIQYRLHASIKRSAARGEEKAKLN